MNSVKSTVYLDQNIFGYLRDGFISLPINENISWIYSNEHLAEIKRSNDLAFLYPLEKLAAQRIQFIVDNNFSPTNESFFEEYRSPLDTYTEFINETTKYPEFGLSRLQAFLFGNIGELNPALYVEELSAQLKNLLPESLKAEDFDNTISRTMVALRISLEEAKKNILPINELREMIAHEQFSNLSPENGSIIDQIWGKIVACFPDFSQDEFFGKTSSRFFKTSSAWTLTSGISWCYLTLNLLGYWPDRHISKVASITSSNSDAQHVAYSSRCDALLTSDKRLAKKAAAVFAYFNIDTKIIILELKRGSD